MKKVTVTGSHPSADAEGRVLVNLVSQLDMIESLPNVGDRALHRGYETLLRRHAGARLIAGNWKTFPYMTFEAAQLAGGSGESVLDGWYRTCTAQSVVRFRIESMLAAVLGPRGISRPWLTGGLDRIARRRTGQTFWQAVGPRILRRHFAADLAARIATADAAVFSAGGLLADHLSHFLPGRLFEIYLAKRLGKPVAMLNYSLSLSDPRLLELAGPALRTVDVHILREARSRQVLLDLGIEESRIRVSVDSAFAVPVEHRWRGRNEKPRIGLFVRGDRAADLAAWAALIDALRDRFAAGNFLVGIVLRRRVFRRLDRLRDALRQFAERRVRAPDDPIPDEIGEIAGAMSR